jgi:TonB-linked SusC/RagA family outer membrane protein
MRRILLLCLTAVFTLASSELWAQERTISGRVASAEDGQPLPGVSVVLKGTTNGTVTDVDGKYSLSVPQSGGTLSFTFIGLQSRDEEIGSRASVDVQMSQDVTQLSEVVVTALNEKRETKTLPYASQEVKAKSLNITQDANIKNALAGKVAGVQVVGQAGSKLGAFGKIRVRGALSLTNDNDPLYIIDGVPGVDPNDIDMENVESVNVLKGPNATALYGQRAESGAILITTKKGSDALSVEISSATTVDKVAYLPKYQNMYGGGYEGDASFGTFDKTADSYPAEWDVFDGKRYLLFDNNYADESWGPKFDDKPYVPWYAWWPGTADNPNPYYGQTANYSAQPNNVKNFFEDGLTMKNTVAVSGGNKVFNGRVSYSNLDQTGIMPSTWLKKHFINTNLTFNATEKLSITSTIRFTKSNIRGDFDDGYGNQTTGSLNSWFNRNLDMGKMKEMKDLKTLNGHQASWNWWGPDYYLFGSGYQKPAFWFNPYTYMDAFKNTQDNNNFTGSLTADYKLTEKIAFTGTINRNQSQNNTEFYVPFLISNSAAPDLYNPWINSFGVARRSDYENNYSGAIRYKDAFGGGKFDISALVGGNIRANGTDRFSAAMSPGNKTGGLIIPDLYQFSNAGEVPTPATYRWKKQVNSIYANVSLGYNQMIFLDLAARKDWSSALPSTKNGYAYPSIGASFIFSELMDNQSLLSFGKLRTSWAQVGNDVDALLINQIYPIAQKPFGTTVLQYSPTTLVDPNLTPALNSSFEAGFDTKWFENRVTLSFTYYKENKKDEIIPLTIPAGSGYSQFLTNAGEVQRNGIEISLGADVVRMDNGFTWNTLINWSKYNSEVLSLPSDLQAINAPGGSDDFANIFMIHQLGQRWGQLRGRGIKRDDNGNKVVDSGSGLYQIENDVYYGSVIPDFNGGFINTFSFKGLTLQASIDFQKGGKFFSLTEMWGSYSGLLEPTAATNDRGGNVRDDEAELGGVHVTAVDETGATFDGYVNGQQYYQQFQANVIPEPYIHSASYMKLRDLSLSYNFASLIKNKRYIKGATLGVVARNVARFGLAKDNVNKWDPSELSNTFGENAQLPGTRSYGVNVKLTF